MIKTWKITKKDYNKTYENQYLRLKTLFAFEEILEVGTVGP